MDESLGYCHSERTGKQSSGVEKDPLDPTLSPGSVLRFARSLNLNRCTDAIRKSFSFDQPVNEIAPSACADILKPQPKQTSSWGFGLRNW